MEDANNTRELKIQPQVVLRAPWPNDTFIGWPHSIPLYSFSVSTMATSSILLTLFLHCAGESFQLKNTIGLLF